MLKSYAAHVREPAIEELQNELESKIEALLEKYEHKISILPMTPNTAAMMANAAIMPLCDAIDSVEWNKETEEMMGDADG
ncbi:MAG: hypothetical protein AAGA60_09460 [Cyanobacteria bacterium P01_E01_bin.42]